jgi:hypothetical protein
MKERHVAIIDNIGRTIIGVFSGETDNELTIHNPVILHVQPDGSGQIQVQSFPLFFFEFLDKENRDKNNWTYNKSSIVTSDVVLDDRIVSQYQKINNPPTVVQNSSPKVVDINDL